MFDSNLPAVLVLDGDQRSALAVVRSLGARRVRVVVAESGARSLAGASRYCWRRGSYASPASEPERFVADVRNLARVHGVSVILPITDVTTAIILRHRALFDGLSLPFPAWEAYDRLTNKHSLLSVAATAGVRVPETTCVETREELLALAGKIHYPVVLKPVYSKIFLNNTWIGTRVLYIDKPEELVQAAKRISWLGTVPMLIQQRVEGEGQGVFALCDHGRVLAWFAHRRLKEKPPAGGVSVMSESMTLSPRLRQDTERLLASVNWHGVAMAEYKIDRAGEPCLIEINGRFWGSLQLAVDAGVDFPWLLYQMATRQVVDSPASYRVGRRLRWLLGDLDRLYLVLKDRPARGVAAKLREILGFLALFRFDMRYEVNRLSDLRPFLYELGAYFRAILGSA